METAQRITIHSSWRGILTSYLGAALIVLVGSLVIGLNGWAVGSAIVLLLGMVLLIGVAFDYPVASTFDAEGVTRHTLVRRHQLTWDRVDQLTRARGGFVAQRRKVVQGGLTAVVGRRRYLLTDHVESLREHERLDDVLADHDLAFGLLLRPPDDIPPSWLYRRKHWRPDDPRV